MTYKEAKYAKEKLDELYQNKLNEQEQPINLSAFLKSLPDHINNVNRIYRHPGMSVAESPSGVCEYPVGLMASSGIPEEAFLSEKELNESCWKVRSFKDDYDW